MGSDSASKKRKRSIEDTSPSELTSAVVRRLLDVLDNDDEIRALPAPSFDYLLCGIRDAFQSALSAEAIGFQAPQRREEDWDWKLSPEQIAGLTQEEKTIWKAFLGRDQLCTAKIKVHPFNWTMPVLDLRQWEAHIPGPAGTPWEGGVYSLSIIFRSGSPDSVPRLRFVRPLFHVNAYPTGVWGYTHHDYDVDPGRLATLLRSVQQGLGVHNISNPSHSDAYTLARNDPIAFAAKIRAQAEDWKPDPQTGLAGRRVLSRVD
ncbi:ubiquitin-conjugating enzyme/RWD-like protein [Mycena rebaudengoi]|nr:ubiquitin-conjugating enzyme/RWD-like protein [Mycena rebaudengoi]